MSKKYFLFVLFIIFTIKQNAFSSEVGENNTPIWLECKHKSVDNEIESDRFIINTKNKTVEGADSRQSYKVVSFDDGGIVFNFDYRETSMLWTINRKTGFYSASGEFNGQNAFFNGSCKRISEPKPIF